MIGRAAQIIDDHVNVVIATTDVALEFGWAPLEEGSPIQTGWRYIDGKFYAPLSDAPDGTREGLVGYILQKRWNADDHVASYIAAEAAFASMGDGTVTSEADVDALWLGHLPENTEDPGQIEWPDAPKEEDNG